MTKRKINAEEEQKNSKKRQIKNKKTEEDETESDSDGSDVASDEDQDEQMDLNECAEPEKKLKKLLKAHKGKDEKSKTDWKAFKAEKKDLKITRKKSSCSFFETSSKAKSIWEVLRKSDCPKEKQKELENELHQLLKGNYAQVVYTHDMARIVQWIIKTGDEKIHSEITTELKPSFLAMVQQKYSSFCISKMLEKGSKLMVKAVVDSFIGNTVKLMSHNIASKVVTVAYSKHANSEQKSYMRQDFYGEMFKLSRNTNVQCLEDAFKVSEAMKDAIIASTKTNLHKVISKGQVASELVHTVLRDLFGYLGVGTGVAAAAAAAEREELLALIRPALPALPVSKHGAWISMHCLWTATPKDRKLMMKACKKFTEDLVVHEHGHLTLLAMMDCVDDTVLLSKVILSTILEEAHKYADTEYGKNVILYMTAHRDTQFFHPYIINVLKEGDDNPHSKKSMDTRRAEIIDVVSKPLLQEVTKCPLAWIKSYPMCMVTLAILKNCKGPELEAAYKSLAHILVLEDSKLGEGELKECAVENIGLHKMLRRLIENDKLKYEQDNDAVLFSEVLSESLGPETVWWLKFNRGAFLLVFLLETNIPCVVKAVQEFLQSVEKEFKSSKTTGATILQKKLTELKSC